VRSKSKVQVQMEKGGISIGARWSWMAKEVLHNELLNEVKRDI
jgi:hypothetical protein